MHTLSRLWIRRPGRPIETDDWINSAMLLTTPLWKHTVRRGNGPPRRCRDVTSTTLASYVELAMTMTHRDRATHRVYTAVVLQNWVYLFVLKRRADAV